MGGPGSGGRPSRGAVASRQVGARLTPAEYAVLEAVRRPGETDSQVVRLALMELAERRRIAAGGT